MEIAYAVIGLFFANAGLILWMRGESRSDWRHMDNRMDAHRKEVNDLLRSIQEEMKDFHDRLCDIEERRLREVE